MKFVLIHGPPAAGKLTIALELERLTGFKVLHNHLTFNAARALFAIGDPRHVELHRKLRLTMLEESARSNLDGVILTLMYFEPDSVSVVQEIKSICKSHQIELHSVFVHCSEEELYRRISRPDRTANGKLDSREKLRLLLKHHRYIPIPDIGTFVIDTTALPADKASELIANRFIPDASTTEDA